MRKILIIGALLAVPLFVLARDASQVRKYRAEQVCPATGQYRGACPGYVVDHIMPLCLNGADDPSNMIWQPKAEALEKDKIEWAMCRWVSKLEERKAAE